MFERVAQQDALAGGGRFVLDAVTARAKADVDPAIDVRAWNLEQTHPGIGPVVVDVLTIALGIELDVPIAITSSIVPAVQISIALGARSTVQVRAFAASSTAAARLRSALCSPRGSSERGESGGSGP